MVVAVAIEVKGQLLHARIVADHPYPGHAIARTHRFIQQLEQGLPADLARRMARATVSGAGSLLARSDEDAAVLRRNVTSPKGTTERALAVLMAEDAWPALVSRAIAAATARSRELSA